jgi:hypothetical protein
MRASRDAIVNRLPRSSPMPPCRSAIAPRRGNVIFTFNKDHGQGTVVFNRDDRFLLLDDIAWDAGRALPVRFQRAADHFRPSWHYARRQAFQAIKEAALHVQPTERGRK